MTIRRKDTGLTGNGGKYAPYEADEAAVADLLVAPQPTDVDDLWGQKASTEVATPEPTTEDETPTDEAWALADPDKPSTVDWDDPEQLQQIMKTARQVARNWGNRRGAIDNGMDVDDIAQEAITAVLKLRAKGTDTDIRDVYGYINRAAANIASRAGRRVRHEDLEAYRQYRTRLNELTTIAGRELSTPEKDQVAQQIRDNWPEEKKNHRPSPDFRNNVQGWEKVRSATMTEEVFDMSVSMTGSATGNSNYVEPGSNLDKALSYVDGDEDADGTRRSARKFLWNALAESAPGTPTIEPHLGHRAVTQTLATITSEEQFDKAMQDWGNGVDNDSTAALMAPWRDQDIRDQASAANLLEARADYAYGMWQAAVTAAARPRGGPKGDN